MSTAKALVPLWNWLTDKQTGLHFEVDPALYPDVTRCRWTLERGHVAPLATRRPSWMTSWSLARHVARAETGQWTLYKDDFRRNVTKGNLQACTPDEWRAQRDRRQGPEREPSTPGRDGVVWAPRFGGYCLPYHAKNPSSTYAEFFATQDDALAYREALHDHFCRGALDAAPDLELKTPVISVHERFSLVPLYPSVSLANLLPPNLSGRDLRGFQSANAVLLVLRFFTQRQGQTECFASLEAIRRILNASTTETISRCLRRLKAVGAIDYEPARGPKVGRHEADFFQKWLPHRVRLALPSDVDEPCGYFPADLFNDERYHDLSFLAQSVLISLHAFTKIGRTAAFSLEELGRESLVATDAYVLRALDELDDAGLITGYPRRLRGQHLRDLRAKMSVQLCTSDLIE